jgi:predicted SAM-dependent methyltransferase
MSPYGRELGATAPRNVVRLDVGCGSRVRAGYVGVDVRPLSGVSIVCNAWEIDRYVAPHTVQQIYTRHFLEHFTFAQGWRTLAIFRRILRAGGTLTIIVPDLLYHVAQFTCANANLPCEANARWTVRQHALAGFWGWQRDGESEYWDVHKSGYDAAMLEQTLVRASFANVERLADRPWNLSMQAIAAGMTAGAGTVVSRHKESGT